MPDETPKPKEARPKTPTGRLRVRIAVPSRMVIDEDAAAVRAFDHTGEFGVRPGFEPFYTCLDIGIVTITSLGGAERFVAVRRGVMTVRDNIVDIVTRDAVAGESLDSLERDVLGEYLRRDDDEKQSDTAMNKMQLAAMRQLVQYESAQQ